MTIIPNYMRQTSQTYSDWLSVPERLTFRLCVLVYRCLRRREHSPDIWVDAVCVLLSDTTIHPRGTVHQTFNARWPCLIPSGFGTCVEQPAVVCQKCTVADDVQSGAEDCTFLIVVRQWLVDRDCTAQYNCCLPATTMSAILSFLFAFLFNFIRCPCNVFDVIVSP